MERLLISFLTETIKSSIVKVPKLPLNFLLTDIVLLLTSCSPKIIIIGILFIYGTPFMREIPLRCAEIISEKSEKNKFVPLIYLLVVFVAIPLTIITLGK